MKAGEERLPENVHVWVEWLLIPNSESRVRATVGEELGQTEWTLEARPHYTKVKFNAVDAKFSAKTVGPGSRIESLEKRIPVIWDTANLKFCLAVAVRRTATCVGQLATQPVAGKGI
ncbi:MAG: hypothetical protein JRM99_06020 [Nitrososphaerota archaeon]|nr:hypothetical protein [Nitrososphaerota archaeon]